MGNSTSSTYPCFDHPKDRVHVMRADGSLLKFKNGVLSEEVVAAHRGHRVLRCDTEGTVMRASDAMHSNRLYFLVPEESARCRKTYDMFCTVGVSKGLVPARKGLGGANRTVVTRSRGGKMWTPGLGTITEIFSSSSRSSGSAAEKSREQSLQSARNPTLHRCTDAESSNCL